MSAGNSEATEARLREYLKRAVTDLRTARRSLTEHQARAGEPLAVIGIGCRFPGGINTPDDLWEAVRDGRDLVGPFPVDRGWDLDALYDPTGERFGTSYVKEGAFLDELAMFDAGFFGISPREALAMDPQQRIILEVAWEAFEHARIDPTSLHGTRTGVYVGATDFDYGRQLAKIPPELEGNVMIGRSGAVTSGRIAYFLGLHGPAVTVDTMCSSSLVATHLAVKSLRTGDCSLAVVGGTTALSTPEGFIEFSRQKALSRDGRCRAFAAGADGTGWAEGVGVVLLERLSDARRHGHRVLALIRGSAINSDGASNGLTAPNGTAQRRVIEQALADARVAPGEVDAVEAHGTATLLGDPIEANALLSVYGRGRPADRPLWLGSFKSNLAHSASASGVAGVIKTVMALHQEELPRTLHVDEPTPRVDWSSGTVRLLTENRPWRRGERPRRAGVSAFGASGTNAHVILEEAPADAVPGQDGEAPAGGEPSTGEGRSGPAVTVADLPWVVSGHTADALRAQARRLAAHLRAAPDPAAPDVAFSLATTRAALTHRAVVVGPDRRSLLDGLDALAAGTEHSRSVLGRAADSRRPVFLFPGQGAQWAGMARRLLDESPAFRVAFDACATALAPYTDWSLAAVLAGDDESWLDRVDVVQPALWAVMVALAETWRALGVEPAAVAGHSQGEIAAACVAGALSLDDGARVVALRSRAIAEADLPPGGMLSVALPRAAAEKLLADDGQVLSLAAVNGASSVVVSGPVGALDALTDRLRTDGVRHRRIPVDYASHSPHVEALREPVLTALAGITPRPGRVPLYSSVTGAVLDTSVMDAEYWFRNLRATVELDQVVRALVASGHDAFLEVSPHPVLLPPIGETLDELTEQSRAPSEPLLIGTLRRDDDGIDALLLAAGTAFCAGVRVDWGRVTDGDGVAAVDLPRYAFQRRRYWLDPAPGGVSPRNGPDTAAPEGSSPGAGGTPDGASSPTETAFWSAVDAGDVPGLLALLDDRPAGDQPTGEDLTVGDLLPRLARWRASTRDRAVVGSWRYHVTWQPAAPGGTARLTGTWLLLVPAGTPAGSPAAALADEVTRALSEHGARPAVVGVDAATVTRDTLSAQVTASLDGPLTGVLSMLATVPGDRPGHPGVPIGLAAHTATVQALGDAGITAKLWVLTSGAVRVTGDDPLDAPEQATSWGLGRVVALERPTLWGGLVDVPAVLGESGRARLVTVLAGLGDEDQLAVRRGGVFVRRLVRGGGEGEGTDWTAPECVLLTGGTGGIGAQIARYLARGGTRRLILLSRRGPKAPGAAELVAELAGLGAEAVAVAADTGDTEALTALRDAERDAGTPVTGVFHIAGAGRLESVESLGLDGLTDTVPAKVAGARALDRVFDGAEVREFVLFSSISSVWGSGEHGAYAAANAYLDALAEQRRARSLPGVSVVWGIWDPAESGGMAGNLVEEQLRARGVPFMDPRLALRALGPVLASGRPVPVVARVEWPAFAPVFTSARPSPLLATIPEAVAALRPPEDPASGGDDGFGDRVRSAPTAQRARLVLDAVRGQVAATLRMADPGDVDISRPLRELGFDSLTAVDLRNRLNALTGLRLRATVVFDHPDVRSLARVVLERLTASPGPSAGPSAAPPPTPPPTAAAPPSTAGPSPDIDTLGVDELVEIALARTTHERG